jgi:hypothetical protein
MTLSLAYLHGRKTELKHQREELLVASMDMDI